MKKLITSGVGAGIVALAFPVLVFAQQSSGLFFALDTFATLVSRLIPIIIGLAVLYFLWGVLKYVIAKSEDEQKEARNVMLMGVIVLFVMVSVWGLVNLLADTLNLNENAPPPPQLPGFNG